MVGVVIAGDSSNKWNTFEGCISDKLTVCIPDQLDGKVLLGRRLKYCSTSFERSEGE